MKLCVIYLNLPMVNNFKLSDYVSDYYYYLKVYLENVNVIEIELLMRIKQSHK